MKNHIKGFINYLNESKSIAQLDPREEQPMIKGIAQILRGVRDKRNRQELAERQVKGFRKEGIRFDYAEFFKLCGLDK
jgi:hypothetical protein